MTTDTAPSRREPTPNATNTYESPTWSTWTRRLVTVVLLCAAVFAATLLRPMMQILMLSSIITFLLFAPARAITRRTRLPYAVSVVLFYVLFIALCVFMILILIPATIRWSNDLIDSIETAYVDLHADLEAYKPEDGVLEIFGVKIDFNPIIEPTRNIMLGKPEEPPLLVTETAET